MNETEILQRWEVTGLLDEIGNETSKKNAATLYQKMAEYLISKENNIKNNFEVAALPIIYIVIKANNSWNGPFIPSEIERKYCEFYESINYPCDKEAEASKKTSDYYSMNKGKKKPKNGGIPSIR